ncbi:MAG: hypothetical protein ABSB83_06290, partial [Methanomassiliicoccales archaeon]
KKKLFDGGPGDLVERVDVLTEASLELPSLLRMMSEYREKSGRKFALPLTIDEALRIVLEQEKHE